jgi:hypothetical protein
MDSFFPSAPHRQSTPVPSLALRVWIIRYSAIPVLFLAAGCAVPRNTFVITDHRMAGDSQRYCESFDEAYYDVDGYGDLNLVLRRTSGEGKSDSRTVEQVLHIRTVWRSIPGETIAHDSQINATVSYYIVAGRTGASFEGAGSVFFQESRARDRLSGSLDLALLRPGPKIGGEATGLFERAELRGAFHAIRDPRRTHRLVHDVQRRFEPIAGS